MPQDIVIGIDSSTQSTKAIAWDLSGAALAEGRADIPMSQPGAGLFEQDPNDWWRACCEALKELMPQIDASRVAGVAISNQRETVGFFDHSYQPSHPALVWLDERCGSQVDAFARQIGVARIHEMTGRHPDLTPVVYSLAWMKQNDPEVWAKTAHFLDVHGYLSHKLTGKAVASTTSVDAFGVFDIERLEFAPPILEALELSPDNFAIVQKPGTPIGTVTPDAAQQTGLPAGTPLFTGGGDGQCAGLGVKATTPGSVYLNLGTAVITGASSPDKMIDKGWRTITSQTGSGYFMESCLRSGTFLTDWLVQNIGGRPLTPETFAALEAAAELLPVGSEGVTMSPFLSGCMDPHWDVNARTSFHGMGGNHRFEHMFRATLEAVTLQSARFVLAMQNNGVAVDRLIAVGGGSSNALWTKMLADSTGLPLVKCLSREASSLGAAISAAVGAGLFANFDDAAEAMVQFGDQTAPDLSQQAAWAALSERQAQTYQRS